MIGFRAGLSTQDAMKLIKNQVIDRNPRDARAILGLDLEKAFDNILHSFLLGTISSLELGKHFHDYTRSFLADREAMLKVGDLASDLARLGSRGTPQGSVISPTLFNPAMIGLSRKLSEVYGINTLFMQTTTPYGAPVTATDA
ncbi:protein YkfC-like [Dermacentor silvarum]|uniref:protein YkfC-like n=1 Tax=Dermacentor silvarum TaxID=543639 RepID=UPI00189AD2B9|nr:protein YkfC-like [Dermacentor silvarum]